MALVCRICGSRKLEPIIDFGLIPVAHRLRRAIAEPDPRYPVCFHLCGQCELLQIAEPIDPDLLYADTDAYSTAFQRPPHLADLLTSMVARKDPGPLLEIGCNDGYLLKMLRDWGFDRLLGIEPNRPVAELGRKDGLDIVTDFFGMATLPALMERAGGGFDFIVARHVLEHVEAVEDFLGAIRAGLNSGGLLVLELPSVEAGMECGSPTILWEEHVNYFTEPMLERLLAIAGFRILDRRRYAFGGGTVAFLAERDEARPAMPLAEADWRGAGLGRAAYDDYAARLARYRIELRRLVEAYRAAGWRIAIYGAAPRSCTVINFAGIGDLIDLAIDDRADIQGRYVPGTDRAVVGLDAVDLAGPPVLFLLGVGSENEHKVRRRIAGRTGQQPRAVSLFAPRDAVGSFGRAMAALGG